MRYRVSQGGHDVPTERIRDRYQRSLEQLREAVRYTDRSFFFDTSGLQAQFIAETAGKGEPMLHTDQPPQWFQTYLLECW